ncbi:MAG: hypothetical protein OEZ34_07735 [Spirochaetia bacterium]|nr:hypothetical protein [Spirochaetia bacterium]
MLLKCYSMHLGFREFKAKLITEEGQPVLYLEDFGKLRPLDYIKQGFKVLEATPSELQTMDTAGYPVRVERR